MKYSKYPSYLDSGVEWLGEIPGEWNIKPFWTLYKRDKKTGYPNEMLLSVYRDYGVIQKSSRDDNNNKASEDLSAYQLVNPSDLAMNKMKAWQGSLGVSEYRGIVSPAYFVFESLHNEYDQYLHHLMRSPRYIAGYLSMSKGIRVNQWDLDPQYHSRMPIILPPYQEQQTIANYLDKATAKIDTLIEKQTKLIELLKEKRQAVISTAVTRGLDSTVAMKDSGVEWLGEIPEGWKVKKLKFISTVNDDALSDNTSDELEINYIDIGSVTTGYIQSYEQMSYANAPSRARRIIKDGDILVSTVRTYLKAIAPVSTLHNNYIASTGFAVIRSGLELDSSFTKYALLSNYFIDLVESRSVGVSYPAINASDLVTFSIALPSLQGQQTVAKYLDDKTAKIDNLITKATKAIELLKEKRTALISAAVTGKIDVRGEVA